MPTIRISTDVYKRLESHAKGFSTPALVIEMILNEYEGRPNNNAGYTSEEISEEINKPTISFYPDEKTFKQSLVAGNPGTVSIRYNDGSSEKKMWVPSRFNEQSNLRGNIWSGLLRDWKSHNIISAEFYSGE